MEYRVFHMSVHCRAGMHETDIAIFKKNETDTDVGIEKNRKNQKPTKKYRKKTKIRFLLMTIY